MWHSAPPCFSALFLMVATQAPVSLALPGVSVAGVDQGVADAAFEQFATVLGQTRGLKVSTARDLQNVLGLERQRQLLGCTAGGDSCIAEIAGSLGVDALLTGTLALVGSKYVTTLRVLRARDGTEVASSSSRLSNLDEVTSWLDAQAPVLADKVLVAFGRSSASVSSGPGFLRAVPALAGVVVGGVGAGLLIGSSLDRSALQSASVPAGQIDGVAQRGQTLETAGWIMAGVGAAGLLASGIWFIATPSPPEQPRVTFMPTPTGGMVLLQGGLP